VLRTAINLHQAEAINPFGVLRTLGGADIAAMTGFILGAATRRLPVIMDGFTAGAAALAARALAPDSLDALIFPHADPSRPHLYMLRFLSVEPLLDLRIHEEEGFGAALGLEMLDLALHQYAEVQGPT
jgi:nicotinate-nucleotide--dimethylbenzimidazole phosphoribosyltransferase